MRGGGGPIRVALDKLTTREARIQHLILRTGLGYEEGWVAWSHEALAVLRLSDNPAD